MKIDVWNWRQLIRSDETTARKIYCEINKLDGALKDRYLALYEFYKNVNTDVSEAENLNELLGVQLSQDDLKYILNYPIDPLKTPAAKNLNPSEFDSFVDTKITSVKDQVDFDFDLEIRNNSEGFAEYWSRFLTGNKKDLFVLFKNEDTLEMNNLDLTIEHEVLGHGVFDNYLHNNNPTNVDMGSLLIEGWATFIEWNNSTNPRSKDNKDFVVGILKAKIRGDFDEIKRMFNVHGYSNEALKNSLNYYKNEIGFSESYALGALLIERRLKDVPKGEWLDTLLKCGCVDFDSWKV